MVESKPGKRVLDPRFGKLLYTLIIGLKAGKPKKIRPKKGKVV